MLKNHFLALLFAAFLTGFPVFACATENPENSNPGLLHSIEANRSLLKQYHNDYIRLRNEAKNKPTATLDRKMRDLEDKISALEEDAEELHSFLPINRKAIDFLKELTVKEMQSVSSPSQPAYQLHEQALKYVAERKFREALAIYEDIVLKNPDDDEAYLIMGHACLLTGQYQKAVRAFHNAINIDPQNAQEITPFYENRVLQSPDDDMAFANLGYAYLIIGDLLKAKNAFAESLLINPENNPAQNGALYVERMLSER